MGNSITQIAKKRNGSGSKKESDLLMKRIEEAFGQKFGKASDFDLGKYLRDNGEHELAGLVEAGDFTPLPSK